MIGRAKITALEQSTLKTLIRAAEIMGYTPGVDFNYNAHKHIITWSNGSETILKDLFLYPSDPDFISLGSTEYTDVFIDEGAEITLKAFDITNSRIRWMLSEYGLIPKILVTCNPSPGWIKDNYITDPVTNRPVELQPYQKFVKALVTDNPDPEFVQLYSDQLSKMKSEYDKQRLLFGNWDISSETPNPFLYSLDESQHFSRSISMEWNRPVFLAIDFNLIPFACLVLNIYTDSTGFHVNFVNEISIDQGSIQSMGQRIKSIYASVLHSLILTGDSLGRNRNITQADNASNYEMLRRIIGLRQNQIQVPSNPLHETSRNDCNYLLNLCLNPLNKVHVKINPDTCPTLTSELRITQCDPEGGIIKEKRTDIAQRADFIDCFRYAVNTFCKREIERHQKANFGRLKLA